MGVLVAVEDVELAGFAHYVVHPVTWSPGQACYLEDLFVRPQSRGASAGRALIDAVIETARRDRCARVYWHTRRDNAPARRLYDRYVEADDFVRYVLRFET